MPVDSRLSGFDSVVSVMHRIKDSGNAWPKVKLAFNEHPLVLTVAGPKSRTPDVVNLTDGGGYGQNKWYGNIDTFGVYAPSESARNLHRTDKIQLWELLARLKRDPERVFAEYGRHFGVCCLCGRELTNKSSVRAGIGPVCREKAFG